MVPKSADVFTFQKDEVWWYKKRTNQPKIEYAAFESEGFFFPPARGQLGDMDFKKGDKELVAKPDWHFSNSAL